MVQSKCGPRRPACVRSGPGAGRQRGTGSDEARARPEQDASITLGRSRNADVGVEG